MGTAVCRGGAEVPRGVGSASAGVKDRICSDKEVS